MLSTSRSCKSSPLGLLCSRLISGLGTTMPSPKLLDDILKLDSLTDKTPEDIEALWMEVSSLCPRKHLVKLCHGECFFTCMHAWPLPPFWPCSWCRSCSTRHECTCSCVQFHSDDFKGRAAMVVPADEYELLRERASSAPLFVLPLGKGQGRSLSMLLQWQMPHALFTGLDDYRACAL